MAKETGVSLKPSEAVEGGGLLDDVDAVVKEASFAMFDYQGQRSIPIPTLQLILEVEGEEKTYQQNWSVGKPEDWMPSEDGKRLIAIGKAQGLNTTSNTMLFLTSLVNAGYPEDKLTDDVSDLVGLEAHFNRVAAPNRAGLVKKEGDRDQTVLIVTDIKKLPWETKKATGKPAKTATTKAGKTVAPPPTEGGVDLSTKAAETIMEIVVEEGGTLAKKAIPAALFKKLAGDPDKNDILKIAYKDDFLGAIEGLSYADGILTLE